MLFFKKKEKHDHDYKVLASHNETIKERAYTHILFQCSCGDWYVDTSVGTWSKEDLSKLN